MRQSRGRRFLRSPAVAVVRAGLVAEIAGIVVIALVLGVETPWYAVAGGLLLYGFGVGLATAQLTGVILADVPVERSGQGSGTQSTSRQVGSALGIAILGTVLFTALGAGVADRLPTDLPEAQREQISELVVDTAGSAIAGLEEQNPAAAVAAREAFSDATRWSALAAAGFLLLGLAATASLGRSRGSREGATTG